MLNRIRNATRYLGLFVTPILLHVLGCSPDDGLGKRYPASGTVKYKGRTGGKGTDQLRACQGRNHTWGVRSDRKWIVLIEHSGARRRRPARRLQSHFQRPRDQ